MGKPNLDKQLFYSKILFALGFGAFLFFPQYAYYWKRSTMDVRSNYSIVLNNRNLFFLENV